jgi:dephospho-CoA kinase
MGKSTTAQMFADAGVPVYDADAEVKRLYAQGGAGVGPVEAAFPGVARDGAIDRDLLAAQVLGQPEQLRKLNAIVWPLMGRAREAFFENARITNAPMVVLDIPLLYETGGEKAVDAVAVVSAPAAEQRARVLTRPGMTVQKFEAIMAAQMPDEEKRKRADFIIDTGFGLDHARLQVENIMSKLLQEPNE